jgi:hydroxymethylpyrimidine/phosphomethylpyrimidine kinase
MTAITAITAQNTCGVMGIQAITPDMLAAQIKAVVTDIGVDAV